MHFRIVPRTALDWDTTHFNSEGGGWRSFCSGKFFFFFDGGSFSNLCLLLGNGRLCTQTEIWLKSGSVRAGGSCVGCVCSGPKHQGRMPGSKERKKGGLKKVSLDYLFPPRWGVMICFSTECARQIFCRKGCTGPLIGERSAGVCV